MLENEITLPYKYTPRPYQKNALQRLDSGIKRMILCWCRRSGKDISIFNWCVKTLMKETCTCFYVMPTYSQAKKVIWDSTTNDGIRFLDFIPNSLILQKNQQEMKIRFINGSLLQLIGSDNIDSLMGTNPKIVVFSEYALQTPDAWDFIRPILKINKGTAIFISTPRGRNHFYDLYQMACSQPDWYAETLTYKDTGILTDEDIEKEMQEGMSEELALQEYSCSFDRGVEGAYYAKLITKMRAEDRIRAVIYDPYKMVHTAWDLGWDDCTSVIFFQVDNDLIKILDYEEHSNVTLIGWKAILDKKGYRYGTHLFPHDVEHVDGLSTGLTRKELLEDMQIPVQTVPRSYIADGIEAVKVLLTSRIIIDEKAIQLIKSLENYHREWNTEKQIYSNKPTHDWSSHAADAIRYLAEGLGFIQSSHSTKESDTNAINKYFNY